MESSPPPQSSLAKFASWATLVFGLVCLALVGAYIPISREAFFKVFEEFDLSLPAFTLFIMRIPTLLFPAIAIVGTIAMIATKLLAARTTATLLQILIIALSCTILVVYQVAVFIPTLTLVDGLSH